MVDRSPGTDSRVNARDTRGKGWLEGQVAVITGSSSGIGLAVAERFLAEGAMVVAHGKHAKDLKFLSTKFPDTCATVGGDVGNPQTAKNLVECAVEKFGRLDVMVPNAGIFDFFKPLSRYSAADLEEAFDELFAINVKGYLFAAQAARDPLRESRGSIVFTSSIAGFHAACAGIVYTAAKHAIVGITRQLAHEFAPDIRVNSVAPGGTLTPLSGIASLGQSERTILDNPEAGDMVAQSVPLAFAQEPADHAGLYVLLASRENSPAVTGQVFMSDGGVGVRPV